MLDRTRRSAAPGAITTCLGTIAPLLLVMLVLAPVSPSCSKPVEPSYREQTERLLTDGSRVRQAHVVRWQEVPGHALGPGGWTGGGTKRHDLYLVDTGSFGRWSVSIVEYKDVFAEKVSYTKITGPDDTPLGSPRETTHVEDHVCQETFTTIEVTEVDTGERLLVKETLKRPPCSEHTFFVVAGGAVRKITQEELNAEGGPAPGNKAPAVPRSFVRDLCTPDFQKGIARLMGLGFDRLRPLVMTSNPPSLVASPGKPAGYDCAFDASFGWPCREEETRENCAGQKVEKACALCMPPGWFLKDGEVPKPEKATPMPAKPSEAKPQEAKPEQAGKEGGPEKAGDGTPARGAAPSAVPGMEWSAYAKASPGQVLRSQKPSKGIDYYDERYEFEVVAASAPRPCGPCASALNMFSKFTESGPMRVAHVMLARSKEGDTIQLLIPDAVAPAMSARVKQGQPLRVWVWHLYYDGPAREHGFIVCAFTGDTVPNR